MTSSSVDQKSLAAFDAVQGRHNKLESFMRAALSEGYQPLTSGSHGDHEYWVHLGNRVGISGRVVGFKIISGSAREIREELKKLLPKGWHRFNSGADGPGTHWMHLVRYEAKPEHKGLASQAAFSGKG